MDTSKPISHPTRGKSTSSSSASTTSGRRSPSPSPSSSPATTHHVKPKPTPSTNNATAKSPPSTAAANIQPIKKPMEKAPSPSPRPGKTLSSTPATTSTNREISPKPSSHSPMPRAYYQRTSMIPLIKAQKTPVVVKSGSASAAKTAKPGVDTRSKSLEKRKVIATPSTFVDTSSASDSKATISKAEVIKAAKEGENVLLTHVYVINSPKKPEEEEEKEHGGVVSPVHEQQKEVEIDEIIVDHDQQHDEKQSEALVADIKKVDEEEGGKVGGVVSPVHEQQKEVNIDDIVVEHDQQHDEKQPEALLIENEEVEEEEGGKEEDKSEKADEVKEELVEAMHKSPKRPMIKPAAEEVRPAEWVRPAQASPRRGVAAAVKKEAQRSNDVIEEAKGKFLEKRKNKVLALVGAFETVMAMQEPEVQQVQSPVKGKEEETTTPTPTNEPTKLSEPIDSTEPSEATESVKSNESTGESPEVTE